jgi:hypothetical protein
MGHSANFMAKPTLPSGDPSEMAAENFRGRLVLPIDEIRAQIDHKREY